MLLRAHYSNAAADIAERFGKWTKDRNMSGYESSTPRAVFGLTAAAMAAIIVVALVVVMTGFDSIGADRHTLAATMAAARAPIEAAISPPRIDLLELFKREERVDSGRARPAGCERCAGGVTS
jgi:hypothetical protein